MFFFDKQKWNPLFDICKNWRTYSEMDSQVGRVQSQAGKVQTGQS